MELSRNKAKLKIALKYCKRAVEINPNLPSAHCNLAAAVQLNGDVEGSLQGYYKALEIQGDLMEAHLGLGSAFAQLGKLKEARKCYSRALFFDPSHAEARLYRESSACWMATWTMHGPTTNGGGGCPECRSQSPSTSLGRLATQGQDALYLRRAGLGDTLQFIRYAALIKAQGGKVVAEIQKPLLPLLSRVPWLDQIIAQV